MTDRRRIRASRCFVPLVLAAFLIAIGGGCSSDDETVFSSQGTLASPYDLGTLVDPDDSTSTIQVTFEGTVGTDASYYQITVIEGRDYTITLSALRGDADLVIYAETNQFVLEALCVSVTYGTENEICAVASVVGTTLYIMVPSHAEFGTDFTLNIFEIL